MSIAAEQLPIRYKPLFVLMAAATISAGVLGWLMDIRFDEAFTLETTSRGLLHAIRQAIEFEQQAPLYFALLSLWRRIDLSIPFARLFSLVFYPISIWLAAEAAKRYLKNVDPLFAAAAFAVHQLIVWSTLDIRLYSMITAISAGMLVLFHDGYFGGEAKRTARAAFLTLCVVALYTQYYLGFQLAAFAVALAVCGKWQALKRYILGMIAVGVVFIPMALVVFRQAAIVSGHTDLDLSAYELLREVYGRFIVLFFSIEWVRPEWLKTWLGRFVAAAFGVLFMVKLIRQKLQEDRVLAAVVTVQIAFFASSIPIVGTQPLQARHMIGLVLPMLLVQFSSLSGFGKPKLLAAWLVIIAAVNLVFLYDEHKSLAKPGDFRRMAEYVMQNEEPGQPVLVVHADGILPFRYYYSGGNGIDALPQQNELTSWDPRRNVFRDRDQIAAAFGRWPNATEFWLVSDGWCGHGTLDFNCQLLESYVADNFVTVSEEKFNGWSSVRLIRRRP